MCLQTKVDTEQSGRSQMRSTSKSLHDAVFSLFLFGLPRNLAKSGYL